MTYYEQLKDPRWQRKRLEILQRDDFTCKDCNSKEKQLHVHHTKYINGILAWEYDSKYLITLCMDCHESITMTKREIKGIIEEKFLLQTDLSNLHSILIDAAICADHDKLEELTQLTSRLANKLII